MPISSRVGLTHPESWHKVSEQGYLGLFFYRVRKKSSFEVLLVFFSTFSSQNLKYPTLMHWLASWVNPTSKTHIPCLPTTSQVSPVQFSLDSVALNFRPIWWHGPSLKHCASVGRPNSETAGKKGTEMNWSLSHAFEAQFLYVILLFLPNIMRGSSNQL